MRSFLKIFLACFLAVLVFTIIMAVLGIGIFSSATEDEKPEVKAKTVLVLDMSKPVMDQRMESGFNFPDGQTPDVIGLFDLVRAIEHAATDSAVKGIMMVGSFNPNGFATSEEIRKALKEFKKSKKFIVANSSHMNQRAYELANLANEICLNPMGELEWRGYSTQLVFFKDALDKLGVKPEVFYAGQFKSATEPFRLTKMSAANRLQLTNFLEDLYGHFLMQTAEERKVDTASLRKLADDLALASTEDAVQNKLADKAWYDDEVRSAIGKRIGEEAIDKIHFMAMADYIKADRHRKESKSGDKIAVIFAQGEIVDGRGGDGTIGGDKFRNLLRRARLDKKVKAVVLRVNSPGGSALASEIIHREMTLLKKEKPVVVSMGDYAASGGYYIACAADSIFAQRNTLTGSIGVFTLLFDATKLMNQKLGISFDDVSTSPSATLGTPFKTMTDKERKYLQSSVDSIYANFLRRVAEGRRLPVAVVDSIGQGRIWSGKDAFANGLADYEGGISEAIACAARMAKITDYQLREYPEVQTFWEKLMDKDNSANMKVEVNLRQQMGEEFYDSWQYIRQLKSWSGKAQMRLPFMISN